MYVCKDDDWILVFDLYLRVNYYCRRICIFVEKKKWNGNLRRIWNENYL